MPTATISSKGQVTLPRAVRADLGVSAGDRLDFVRLDDGNYAIVPASRSIRALKGVIVRPERSVSLEEMEAAIERAARADVPAALELLKKAGAGNRPVEGDELID